MESGSNPVYRPVVKFRNMDKNVLRAVQAEQSNVEDKNLSDSDSDTDDTDNKADVNDKRPPHALTFEIDPDVDITLQALRDMILTDQSVGHSSQVQSAPANSSDTSGTVPDWDW
jgi:hypothetical protein